MQSIALVISYNGSAFCGFARQPNGLLTVQGELEHALEVLYRRPVPTVCAGRTDAGVHALGQVVSFELEDEETSVRSDDSFLRSLNAITHHDIGVRSIVHPGQGFSARFDAKSREYRYHVSVEKTPPLVMRDFCWHKPGKVDIEAMREAAAHLIGEHDFKSFCVSSSAIGKPTCRNLMRVEVESVQVMGESFVCITVEGSSFLHSMVRTIVGTLMMVGRGLRDPDWVAEVLSARDREVAGEKAPACGLVFWQVRY